MSKKETQDFNLIVKDILDNQEFNKLNNELHHGITRYDHVLRVAKTTYKFSRFFHMKNTELTTRAALLHDFYTDSQMMESNKVAKLTIHPNLAYENALKYYDINDLQANIIKSHMFPLKGEIPKYKESWLVSAVDKLVAAYEMSHYKASLYLNIFALFLFNLLIQK